MAAWLKRRLFSNQADTFCNLTRPSMVDERRKEPLMTAPYIVWEVIGTCRHCGSKMFCFWSVYYNLNHFVDPQLF